MKTLLTLLLILSWLPLHAAERPNIILIMVDDMGFSDIGCYGGEIETPNIDKLAKNGVRFSHFYNSGRCCPTRATLMTGLHPHQVGIGHMTQPPNNERGKNRPPAYQGYLNRNCVTIAEALKPAGYATLMAGKWHLGQNARDRWPMQRGFEKFFGCLSGATNFFNPQQPRGITLQNELVRKLKSTTDRSFYTTDAFTDYGIKFISEHLNANRKSTGPRSPFFLYLAYTAPHWPIQAHEVDIDKYRERYHGGWDKLREERYQRQIRLGLIDPKWKLSPRDERVPAWIDVPAAKKKALALRMAIYAAMVDRVDQNIGRLVASLKGQNAFDNTLIMFLSDNGACAEGGILGRGNVLDIKKRNESGSLAVGTAWANASSTPFRLYKHYAHEGGAATPFFAHWPAGIKPSNEWYEDPAQLIDLMPTILDVADAAYPGEFNGHKIPAHDGVSLRPAFNFEGLNRRNPLFVEHENNAFVRDGNWKLVGRKVSPKGGLDKSKWELYNLKEDRTELNNLATTEADRAKKMSRQWEAWAKRVGVFPKGK
ncbi:MAG: arylsulfatase [Roseibacillus sp.]|jgi:arylsulfatase